MSDMSDVRGLGCHRALEWISDHLDGSLDPVLAREMEAHLASCPSCAAAREAVAEVVSALRAFPAVDPSRDLAERAAVAAWRVGRATGRPLGAAAARRRPTGPPPVWLQIAAAALAAVTTLGILYATQSQAPAHAANRLRDRTQNAGSYLIERKDHLVEDVRLLRVAITTAFEGRLERVNDRFDDYRRLLERRRAQEEQPRKGQVTFRTSGTTPA
jgi:anti-sigma factor RsiW